MISACRASCLGPRADAGSRKCWGGQCQTGRQTRWAGLPLIAGPDVGVEEVVGISEDLDIDAAKCGIGLGARGFDGCGEPGHALEVVTPLDVKPGRTGASPLDRPTAVRSNRGATGRPP